MFTPLFAKAAIKLVPQKKVVKKAQIQPMYLNEGSLEVPSSALDNVRHETARFVDIIEEMIHILRASREEKYNPSLDKLHKLYQDIHLLENANLIYLGKIRQQELTKKNSLVQQNLMNTNTMLEGIAYTLQTEVRESVKALSELQYTPSNKTQKYIRHIANLTTHSLILSKKGLVDHDYDAFKKILNMKKGYKKFVSKFMKRKAERLVEANSEYMEIVRLETSLVDNLYHIYHLNRLLAKQWIKAHHIKFEEVT